MLDDELRALIADAVREAIAPTVARIERRLEQIEASLPPTLLDIPTAAERLGYSVATVRRRIRDGSIRVVRMGRTVRVDLSSLNAASEDEVARLAHEARRPTREGSPRRL